MNALSGKRYLLNRSENIVNGDWLVFDISNNTSIFAGELWHSLSVAGAFNQFYCLPNKQIKYFIMNYPAVFKSIQETKGASYNLHTGMLNPTTGYMVSFEGFEQKYPIPVTQTDLEKLVLDYVISKYVWNKIASDPNNIYLGFWIDNDELVLDLSENIPVCNKALDVGLERSQKAIYDCEEKKTIAVSYLTILEYSEFEEIHS